MIITRKIQILISEDNPEERNMYYEKIRVNRDIAVSAANFVSSHLYMQAQVIPYIKDNDKLEYIGAKGNSIKKSSTTYSELSYLFKGKINTAILACINQQVRKGFSEDCKKGLLHGNISLRNYKSTMPIPYATASFTHMRFEKTEHDGKTYDNCYFTLDGIPFRMNFGRDRSNNESIVKKVINGEYKMSSSSIQLDDKKNKMYLLLCVDIPKKNVKLIEGKTLYAFLGVFNPITYTTEIKAKNESDSGMKVFTIGTEEEFNHRRREIQEAVKRCQINNRYSAGGKGRKRKCQAVDRYKDKETNYVDTKLHTYSKMLVDAAIRNKCDTICLINQEDREIKAKEDNQKGKPFVLRNWSYFGLKEKIQYKAKMNGIALKEEKIK